ncbi:MAG: hypothetical protein HOF70_14055 [Rhodospirillaceae bacterium]|nr:hypothetical protein [Rhodospirillaceae bacterium]MBT3885903.1 hypothetical protein [Rhodospirillaceae bacterium]MBT4117855.1 hypothetical protein [Rhodospirillaceae bacterium]MBT4672983.1 hypothetical protein [Rhodospirillaceae bacterium]MBT4720117.1 hypothetical protein [Rhodospirillaceae bacterium]
MAARTNIMAIMAALGAALGMVLLPGSGSAGCLSDADLSSVTRSVFTKSLGPVMRICSTNHPEVEERAIDATREFFLAYRSDMRHNRLKTTDIFRRVFKDDWQENLAALLDEATGPILRRAGVYSAGQCGTEIQRIEDMVERRDYSAIMSTGAARKMFEFEREHIPDCGK